MGVNESKHRWYTEERLSNDEPFRRMVYEASSPDSRVLDAGAGAGNLFQYELRDRVKEILGVDLDPRVRANSQLDVGIVADLTRIPIDDESCDVVFSRYVLEHVADPKPFLGEIHRVLKPGGHFLFLTPNKWHYVALVARIAPHSFHHWYNELRGRASRDTFPTHYRMNSAPGIRRHCRRAGFEEKHLVFLECCPNYLTFSMPSFLLGLLYERTVNSTDLFAWLRANIMGWYVKRV